MQEEREFFFRAVDARFQEEVSDIKSCGKLRFGGTAENLKREDPVAAEREKLEVE